MTFLSMEYMEEPTSNYLLRYIALLIGTFPLITQGWKLEEQRAKRSQCNMIKLSLTISKQFGLECELTVQTNIKETHSFILIPFYSSSIKIRNRSDQTHPFNSFYIKSSHTISSQSAFAVSTFIIR
jgi:hypothetical protein